MPILTPKQAADIVIQDANRALKRYAHALKADADTLTNLSRRAAEGNPCADEIRTVICDLTRLLQVVQREETRRAFARDTLSVE